MQGATTMTKGTDVSSSFQDNDTLFGECLKLPYYRGPMEDWMVATNVILIVINIISALITLVANTVFLVTYLKTSSLRTPHYFSLVLLAVTDISVGLVSQPLFIARKIMEIYSVHDCALWMMMRASMYYFSGISFLTGTLVSIERYLAVCRPIKHRNEVTPHRMAIATFIAWAVWLAVPILRFSFSKFYRVFGIFIGAIILAVLAANAYIYVEIYRKVSGKYFKDNKHQPGKGLCEVHQKKEGEKWIKADQKKEARMAKTVACLMLVMILAYLPTVLGFGYKAVAGIDTTYFFGLLPFADSLVLLNSTFNPLFYCYRNVTIRQAICVRSNVTKQIRTRDQLSSSTVECIDAINMTNLV